MTYDDRLIVLNTTRFKDGAVVLHALSRECGRKGYVVSVGKGNAMALMQPMNILDAKVSENPKSSLLRASQLGCSDALWGIRSSHSKNSMTMFMAEVLFRSLAEGSREEGLFEWCEENIRALDALESDFSNYHLRFLLELCSVLGFRPQMENMAPFAGEHMEPIRMLLELPMSESMLVPLTGAARNEIASIVLKYLSFHIDAPLNIQSLAILRELYLPFTR